MALNFKLVIRKILSFIIYYSGLLTLYNLFYMNNKPIILAYHRIVDPDKLLIKSELGMCVKPETFDMQMRYLSKHYNALSLSEWHSNRRKTKAKKTIIITFDDGWKDNYDNGYPILKKYNLPATIFLSTGIIGSNNWFWPEKIIFILEHVRDNFETIDREVLDRLFYQFPFLKALDEINVNFGKKVERIISYLKRYENIDIFEIIEVLKSNLNIVDFPKERLMLNWDEVREMSKDMISYGSHTVNHNILTNLSKKKFLKS